MSVIGSITVRIGADDSAFQRGLRNMAVGAKKISANFKSVGQTMSRNITLPLIGIGVAAIKVASDTEEMRGKFNVVFGQMSKDVESWASTVGKSVNRSKYDLMGYASTLQDTFVPMGMARDKAAQLSKKVAELGVDLASFNNEAEPETINLLTSALVGNHEAVRRFGVVITESTLKQELLTMGIKGGVRAASEQEKMMARLNLVMKSTTDAQGDAARTSGSFANQMRGLKSLLTEAGVTIGQTLIPTIKRFTDAIRSGLEWFNDLGASTRRLIIIFGVVVGAAGPLIAVLGGVAAALPAIAVGIGMLTGPVGLTVAAIGALTAAGVLLYTRWDEVGAYLRREFPAVLLILREAFIEMRETVTSVLGAVVRVTGDAIDNIKSLIKAAGGIIQGDWTTMWTGILEITKTNTEQLRDFTKSWLSDTTSDFKNYSQIIYEGITGGWQSAIADASSWLMGNGLQSFVNDQRKAFLAAVESVFGSSQVKTGSIDFMGSQRQARVVPSAMQNMLGTVGNNLQSWLDRQPTPVVEVDIDPVLEAPTIQQRVDRLRDYIGRHLDLGDIGQSFKNTFGDILGADILTGKKKGAATAAPANTLKITSDMLRQVKVDAEALGVSGQLAADGFYHMGEGAVAAASALADMANSEAIALRLGESVRQGLAGVISAFGEGLGAIIAGTGGLKNIFFSLLDALAGMAIQLGKIAIGVGIGLESIKVAFATMSGVGAIIAGVALIAIGVATRAAIGKIQARAIGGPVSADTPYIVGERGPELFIPRAGGAIVPNYALGGARSNVQVVVLQPQVSTDMMGNFIFAFDRRRELENR